MMDEPYAALDYFTREQMQKELLRVRQKQRCSILFVTHSIDEALLLGHKIVVIENGLVKTQVRVPELEGATGGLTVDDVDYVKYVHCGRKGCPGRRQRGRGPHCRCSRLSGQAAGIPYGG